VSPVIRSLERVGSGDGLRDGIEEAAKEARVARIQDVVRCERIRVAPHDPLLADAKVDARAVKSEIGLS